MYCSFYTCSRMGRGVTAAPARCLAFSPVRTCRQMITVQRASWADAAHGTSQGGGCCGGGGVRLVGAAACGRERRPDAPSAAEDVSAGLRVRASLQQAFSVNLVRWKV